MKFIDKQQYIDATNVVFGTATIFLPQPMCSKKNNVQVGLDAMCYKGNFTFIN